MRCFGRRRGDDERIFITRSRKSLRKSHLHRIVQKRATAGCRPHGIDHRNGDGMTTTGETPRGLLETQRAAFARGAPDYGRRTRALSTLRDALHAHQDELARAVSDDFGGRAHEETLLLELFPLYDQIRHARRHLKRWMRRRAVPSAWFLKPSRAFYQYQPLGVVGVIGAWNYQLLLTIGPLVDALAAGNHVILKPSEITPRSAEVIARIINRAFTP